MTIKELKELKARLQYSLEIDGDCCLLEEDKQAIIEALGMRIPEKPDYEGDGYDENGELVYDTYICPNCGKNYEVDYDDHKFCPNCGQALDRSVEK